MQADQQTGAANSLQTGSEREKNNSSKTSETAVNAEHNQETCNPTRQAYATLIETGLNEAAKVLSKTLSQQNEQTASHGRLAILEFAESGPPNVKLLDQAVELGTYLALDTPETDSPPSAAHERSMRRRLFILEDLPREFVELLGSQLRVHPSFFARHCTDLSFFDTWTDLSCQPKEITQLFLPFMHFMHAPKIVQHPGRDLAELYCANSIVRRILAWPKPFGGWDLRGTIAELECGISYWASEHDGGGWDAVLLVDPGMSDEVLFIDQTQFQQSECRRSPIKIELEAGCIPYFSSVQTLPVDPNSWASTEDSTDSQPVFDQLVKTYASAETRAWKQPFACTEAVRRLALRKWIEFLNHAIHCLVLTKVEPYLNNTHFSSPISASWAPRTEGWLLGRLVKWSRRLHMEHTVISTTMRDLGMDLGDQTSSGMMAATEAKQWRYIRDKLLEYKGLYDETAASYIQVMSLRESLASNDQARSLGTITLVVSLSVPVSVVAGMFSMGGGFAPGEDQFWVFFVVVVPAVMVVWACLFTRFGPWAKRLSSSVFRHARNEVSLLPVYHLPA